LYFFYLITNAQLDTEHWFAPMSASSLQGTPKGFLYLSTHETTPYRYSLNGIDYQNSNIFTGLSRGTHKVFVLGADGCSPVTKEFLVINIINAITPNGDGINDVLDYSELRIKENVNIEVSDRYGAVVYKSPKNVYTWDGKPGGRTLPTGTYWYVLQWMEPETKLTVSYSGWILIKNRE